MITIGGGLLALAGSRPQASTPLSTPHGVAIAPEHAAPLLRAIANAGQPPSDITDSLVVPVGSRLLGHQLSGTEVGLYDGTITFSVGHAPSAVLTFYRAELVHQGWHVTLVAAPATGSGTEVYALRGSGDGYDWEVGVTVRATSGALSDALAGATPTPTSSVSLRLIERDDLD